MNSTNQCGVDLMNQYGDLCGATILVVAAAFNVVFAIDYIKQLIRRRKNVQCVSLGEVVEFIVVSAAMKIVVSAALIVKHLIRRRKNG